MTTQPQYEVTIIGGGMIGSAAALGFARAGFSVALIEYAAPSTALANIPMVQVSALNNFSVNLLEHLDVWESILATGRYAPFRQLIAKEYEKIIFNANEKQLNQLGFMVENYLLKQIIWKKLATLPNVDVYTANKLTDMKHHGDVWSLILNDGHILGSHLLVAADGGDSLVRHLAGITVLGWEYRQNCLLILVDTGRPQTDITWQQFSLEGAKAFLPLWQSWATLVWYDLPKKIQKLNSMSITELAHTISASFPYQLEGAIPIKKEGFSLTRRHANTYIQNGLVLIGDSAHTIHPLAGQGANLGYRDLDVLLKVIITAKHRKEDWKKLPVLSRYQHKRYWDNLLMQTSMDLFYKIFRSKLPGMCKLRNTGLFLAEHAGWLKQKALSYALGQNY